MKGKLIEPPNLICWNEIVLSSKMSFPDCHCW